MTPPKKVKRVTVWTGRSRQVTLNISRGEYDRIRRVLNAIGWQIDSSLGDVLHDVERRIILTQETIEP